MAAVAAAAPFQRTPAAPLSSLPSSLPQVDIRDDVDAASIASTFFQDQGFSLDSNNLTPSAIWRDLFSLTGTLRTFYGQSSISCAWKELAAIHKPYNFALIPGTSRVARFGPRTCWIQANFTFRTHGSDRPGTECSGTISMIPTEIGSWRIWMVSTVLEEVYGFGNPDFLEPALHTPTDTVPLDRVDNITEINGESSITEHYDCVVVGAGMAGLSIAGRFKALGVSYAVLEKYDQIGQNWTDRYESVKLHTCKEYAHLPFGRTFSLEDPYFLTGKDLARGYSNWTRKYAINVKLSTNLDSASWDGNGGKWELNVTSNGHQRRMTARHLVLALGAAGQTPKMPAYANRELFKGIAMHSKDYKSAWEWKGKKGVIIGTANTAHDVAEDMLEAGLSSVTMVQRNTTPVMPLRSYKRVFDPVYHENTTTEIADRAMLPTPISVSRAIAMGGCRVWADETPEFWEGLKRAGFKADPYIDLIQILYERLGGHYLNVGASDLIIRGLIKVKSDAVPVSYTPTGLLFSDGSTLDADVIVFATGFETNMREMAKAIVGEETAEQLDDYWGVDAEGEIRGAWKPIGHPNIWFTGGAIGQARFFSRFLATQIKADLEGVPFVAYAKTPK